MLERDSEERFEQTETGDRKKEKQGSAGIRSLDLYLQYRADEMMVGHRGAVILLNAQTGEIYVMSSHPTFNPNHLNEIGARLNKDPDKPLINRAVSGFPPGSTFKLITSLAGLRRGLAKQRFNCSGGVQYGDHYFQCWISEKHGSHGTLALPDAIKVSCNAFFYQYGNAAGIDSIDRVGELLGLGKPSGLNLTGEQPGVLPGPDWMKVNYPQERWSQAYTANVSIGQGYDLATPLQMAMAYAALANRGISYYPRLVKKVLNQDGTPVLDEDGKIAVPDQPKVHADFRTEISPADIELERRGFWNVVNADGGTGGRARLSGVQVAGKTGTAQAKYKGRQDTISWFVCWAPFDNPKYTVAVMVQGGEHGGSVACPIAARIMERSLAMDEGKFDAQVAWLPPAHKANPFQMIKDVTFKDSGINEGGSDEENSNDSQGADVQMAGAGGDPDVEPEADSRRFCPDGAHPLCRGGDRHPGGQGPRGCGRGGRGR